VKTHIIRVVAISFSGFVVLAADTPTAAPTSSELLDRYTQALDSTLSFISASESSSLDSGRVPSWGLEMHNARSFGRCAERTDGRGHLYAKSLRWGYVSASEQHLTETNARYDLSVVGDGFRYRDDKGLGQTKYKGHVDYQVKGGEEYEKYKVEWGYFMGDDILGYFLGYMSAWRRLDEMLKGARSISVRPKPETINGAVCYVVEAVTIWRGGGVKPGIRNCCCGDLKKADQFRQTFPPSLCELPPSSKLRRTGRRAGKPEPDVAKQFGREILRPQLAFAQKFPLRRHCIRQNRSEPRGFLPLISRRAQPQPNPE